MGSTMSRDFFKILIMVKSFWIVNSTCIEDRSCDYHRILIDRWLITAYLCSCCPCVFSFFKLLVVVVLYHSVFPRSPSCFFSLSLLLFAAFHFLSGYYVSFYWFYVRFYVLYHSTKCYL